MKEQSCVDYNSVLIPQKMFGKFKSCEELNFWHSADVTLSLEYHKVALSSIFETVNTKNLKWQRKEKYFNLFFFSTQKTKLSEARKWWQGCEGICENTLRFPKTIFLPLFAGGFDFVQVLFQHYAYCTLPLPSFSSSTERLPGENKEEVKLN